jgi:hypothetical protein
MLLLYKNAASMPDFILTMEEAQKKAKKAELPILDIELAKYAAISVLQSGDYKKETDEWEGHNASKKTWTEWKQINKLLNKLSKILLCTIWTDKGLFDCRV